MAAKNSDSYSYEDRITSRLLDSSVHFLVGDIDEENITDCIKWITYENLDAKDKTLTLYINSTGGSLYDAFALIDIMNGSRHAVRTIAIGSAMSAAFLILAAGSPGERYVGRNAGLMCHQFSETTEGKFHDIKATMKENEMCNARMINVLKMATGLSPSVIKRKLLPESDVYLTPDEAISLGIADKIL